MAQIKTSNFLPEVYRTETNRKFLNATLDQLVTQPDLRNVNGYVGRKFAPTFKSTDNYIPEPTTLRQNYQLEPSVVVKDKLTGDIKFFSSYIDLIQQVEHSGGFTNNHSRLFSGESYSFDGMFDFDKFVNFNQYYWLEDGPTAVEVYSGDVPTQETFIVTRDIATGTYKFSTTAGVENPNIKLAYGGTYKFVVNQSGFPFWIQSSGGVSGTKSAQTTMSSRTVLGVTNNGIDVGTVTFKVPQPTSQDSYSRMTLAGTADLSTMLSYSQVQGQRLSSIIASKENGIDGVNTFNQLNLKSLIFVGPDLDDSKWTVNSVTVPVANRRNAWQITFNNDSDPILTLSPLLQSFVVGPQQRVYVSGGVSRAEYSYYLANDYLTLNLYNQFPDITAPMTTLYYQDGVSSTMVGTFSLSTVTGSAIYVDSDIIGNKTYTSPNGVKFTNGLKVTFNGNVIPSTYQNKTYYVDGVGEAIALVDTSTLVTPEAFATNGLTKQDYITINRASSDLNSWSRSNRWFHVDVINASATYNNTTAIFDQSLRASRPIIEFDANIQLFNYGRVAKAPVDLINFTVTDSRNAIELQPAGFQLDGVTLTDGMRVIFASDFDPTVRDLIFTVNIVFIQSLGLVINLTPASDSIIEANNNIIVMNGPSKGVPYYFDGYSWIRSLENVKTQLNQAPVFDVIDSSGTSLSTYTNSSFAGTKIFSYEHGTGSNDAVLGFPLSYRTFNQIGDIQFANNFDSDTFNYVDGNGTSHTNVNINTLGWIQKNTSLTTHAVKNSWTTNVEQTKQFQVISGVYDGNNSYFQIDITANSETSTPYFRVYKNSIQITGWELITVGILNYVHVTDATLVTGDQIDIMIYNSDQVSALGYYEVPLNLDYNSENNNFSSLTLGQLRNHASTMVANSNQVIGSFPGNSNLRDLKIKQQGGSILQHASPVLYSELFLVDEDANFIKSIDLARKEYSKLKNKIIETSMKMPGLDFTNIPVLLDTILKNINGAKNKTFAWYYSDMVPYGDIKNTITYTVQSTEIVDYEITSVFSDTTLSNKAILVYLNGTQLVKDVDYSFDMNRAGITITANLSIGDTITIYEYSNTDGNYIPETPTKLGLYPKFTPTKYFDTTYTTPIYVIQGHDGSITPAFGDFRDDLLLEFEKRIYNNIKIDASKISLDLYNFLPGKFRKSDYSINEFTQVLSRSFLQWVGNNKVDYISNTTFDPSNPLTWCYNKFVDNISGQALQGYWRAIYKYFYDTDRPHTHPWEMVGFSQQPSWWETRYGAAPYTSGNMVLWDDMAAGYIWNNGNSYTNSKFIRPNLTNYIPVDSTGTLQPPTKLVKSLNSSQTASPFKIGDQGPVETAWRRSSDYPYAVNQALALIKPGFYFGSMMNVGSYYKNTALNQFIESDSLQRIQPDNVSINGVTVNSTVTRSAGYINWIAESLKNQGIDPGTYLNDYLSNVQIQLAYKMAGYTDQTLMQVIAEQSSPKSTNAGVVIPNESYKLDLHKSTPVSSITYSAVVIERTGTGYTVSGYDTIAPYFTIIPSLVTGKSYQVPVLDDTAVIFQDYQKYKLTIPYGYEFTTRQQVVDFLVSYQRYLQGVGFSFTDTDPDLGTQRDWILSVKEFLSWAQQGWGSSSVLILSPVLDHVTLYTNSGVVDKIENSPTQSCVLDTSYNFVKYSQMTVNRSSSVNGNVFNITVNNGQTIALVRLSVVEYEHIIVFDNVDIFNDVIYVPELGNRQYRLRLVGKKTGSWTGDMNPPGFVYNNTKVDAWRPGTDYLMGTIVSFKNNNYTALKDVPAASTFDQTVWAQLTKAELQTGLLPNFSYNAEKFNRFNDIDNPEVLGDFHLYSDSAIGFQPRQYLTEFGLDEVTQAKFYQGYIRQKGTMNAVNAFTAIGVNGATSDINVYEEWAMRVGEYGALDNNRSADLVLTEGTFNGDPVTFTLLANNSTVSANNVIGVYSTQLYKTEGAYSPTIYKNRDDSSNYTNDIQTAGYVDILDANVTVFNMSDVSSLSANVGKLHIGSTIWTAVDTSGNWNIYRVCETENNVVEVNYSVDNIGVIKTQRPHKRSFGDIVVIRDFDTRVDGVYRVYSVVDSYQFSVVFQGQSAVKIKQAMSISGHGALHYLQSVRISAPTDLNSITPVRGWLDNDKLWVDSDSTTGGWAVYNKSSPWTGNVNTHNPNMKLDANSYVSKVGFGTVATINSTGTFAAASSKTSLNKGNVYLFVSNVSNGNTYTLVSNIGAPVSNSVTNFGASLDTAGNLLYVGNPGNGTTEYGRVHIYKFDGITSFPLQQTLSSPWSSNTGDSYGSSVSASSDGTWLYVSAPTTGNVYVYQANANSYYSYANTISVGSSAAAQFGYNIKTTSSGNQVAISAPAQAVNGVVGAGAVYVFDRSIESFYASGTTYTTQNTITNTSKVTVNGNVVTSGFTHGTNTITFSNAPIVGSLITVETNKFQLLETMTSTNPTSGAAFGSSLWISGNDADIFVSSPGYSVPGYHGGAVYRFVNQGASYGTITGTNYNPVITVGDKIRINGIAVTFTGANVVTAASDINNAAIPGITAVAQGYGALTLTSNVTVPYQKLILAPVSGNAMSNLGLSVFANIQAIMPPNTSEVSQFGAAVASSSDSNTLIISASQGDAYNTMTVDQDETYFDATSTTFFDQIGGSGAVFVYGLVNESLSSYAKDQYVLVQQLQNNSLSENDQFGTSIAINANTMIIGAPGDSNSTTINSVNGSVTAIPSAGTFYVYNNPNQTTGWDIAKQEESRVDIDSVSKLYLYNVNTNVILTHLDYIDPAKGKILGAAQDSLDYITAYDPATYNSVGGIDGTPNIATSLDHHWGPDQVTKTWWNTGTVRYLNYEQGDVEYRAKRWGATFPGSKIQVCEWVASSQPPSNYPGPGVALYPDNSAYSVITTINPNSKLSTSTYYYWVTGKTSLESKSVHRNTISTVQDLIENPQAQDIPYACVLRDDSISLHGISTYLNGNSTVLHMGYDVLRNTNVIHSEYQLVQEGNKNSIIPDRIVNKIVDSLSGLDSNGVAVPDPSLSPQTRIGLGVLPNQTLFVDRASALKNWVEYVNSVLILYPIVKEFNINPLYQSAPTPDYTSYNIKVDTYEQLTYINTTSLGVGYAVLVLADETHQNLWTTYSWNGSSWGNPTAIQSYYTPKFWSLVDWYDETYDNTVLPTYVVQTASDISTLTLSVNDTVKVLNNGNGEFAVYRVNSDGTTSTVGIQNGTIQLNSTLYTGTTASNEIRIIFNTIRNYIFVDTLSVYFNKMFFFLVNYILTEQPNVDWVFKTSFISIIHYFKTLGQPAAYSLDDQTYYEKYINEIKPYRTSIRDYLLNYSGLDEYYGDTTDFDIPATYISSYGGYRSPDGNDARDSTWLSTLPQYSQWANNHTYSISNVSVTQPGANYTLTPTVTVVGGGGTGANVQAIVDFGTGQISGFQVINPGKGYTSQPTFFINGTGRGAAAYAELVNHYQIDSLSVTEITSNSNVTVYAGNIISQANTNAYGTVYTSSTGNVVTLIDTHGVFNTADYIYNDFSNLHTNVTSTSSFTQFINSSYNTVRTVSTTIKFDRTTYNSNVIGWSPSLTVANNSIVSFDGKAYQAKSNVYSTAILTLNSNIGSVSVGAYITQANSDANATVISTSANAQVITVGNLTSNFTRRAGNILVNGVDTLTTPIVVNNVFDYTQYSLLDADSFDNASDRVMAYYEPAIGMPGKDLSQVIGGIEYPGVNVTGVTFEANTSIFSSNLMYTWSNTRAIYSANITIPTVTLNISNAAVVYTGNVITQQHTGAYGTVYSTSTANVITLVDVVGSFSNNSNDYLSANSANLSTTVLSTVSFNQTTAQNLLNFTEQGYSTGQTITLINTDTSQEYLLNITEVDSWRIIVSGNVPTLPINSNLSLKYYDYNDPTFLDTSISNTYKNTNISSVIDGGAYYDAYSSHAPEELVPGVTFDNLNMSVYTGMVGLAPGIGFANPPSGYTSNIGYRIVHNMNANAASTNTSLWPKYYGISASHSTTLASDLNVTDSNIHVTNASVLTLPDFSVDEPGVIFINGEKINFWKVDLVNNILSQIRRAVDGTGAPLVHASGSKVVEASITELIPGGNAVNTTTWLNPAVGAPKQIIFTDSSGNPYNWVDNFGNLIQTVGSGVGAVTDGTELLGSTTDQALFIKGLY